MALLTTAALMLAVALPAAPHFSTPFPHVITDAPVILPIAPGIEYGDYEILTSDGPLSVHVIAVDMRNPTVRIGAALAGERLISHGETVSSMAYRTGAVAGINGDYFDINQTNEPLNILIENGRLIRAPMRRWAIAIDREKNVEFAEFRNGGTLQLGGSSIPLDTINDWPPPGGGSLLLTPEFGVVPSGRNVTILALEPTGGTPPYATYRVRAIADNAVQQPPGYYLVAGLNAYTSVGSLQSGDTVAASQAMDPPIEDLSTVVGGGPLLVKDGAWYADPDGPSSGEFLTHMPASAIGLTKDGTLLLFQIDGRQPDLSIGVLQPQLAALMMGFGVRTGMQFDGGGSATIVARVPGDANATVRNSPSDGTERRVADGLFVYSNVPYGPPSRLTVQPQTVRALPGARVALRIALTDAGGHPLRSSRPVHMRVVPEVLAAIDGQTVLGKRPGSGVLRIENGNLVTKVPVEIGEAIARIVLLPLRPTVAAGATLQLSARAYDRKGFPVALPESLPWTARSGGIASDGKFRASNSDGAVTLRLGTAAATERVWVGEHLAMLPLSHSVSFATAPRNEPGGITESDPCPGCIALRYDFTGNERAAYAATSLPLPAQTLALAADVYGDGKGETLRVAVNNAIGERFLYTVARIDWRGWRRLEVRLPAALAQPLTLKAIYVIDRVGPQDTAVRASGAIALRSVAAVAAGSGNSAP